MPNESTPSPDAGMQSPGHAAAAAFSDRAAGGGSRLDTRLLFEIVARLEAAGHEPRKLAAAALSSGLGELTAIAGRIESALLAGEGPAPDVETALTHIRETATALRTHDTAPAVRAALEAAVREVGEAIVRGDAAAARAVAAAAEVRYLASRIAELSALAGSIAASPATPLQQNSVPSGYRPETARRLGHDRHAPMADSAGAPAAGDSESLPAEPRRAMPLLPDKEAIAAPNEPPFENGTREATTLEEMAVTLGPREDPAELFEPFAGGAGRDGVEGTAAERSAPARSIASVTVETAASEITASKMAASETAASDEKSQAADERAPASDPLAPLRALSEAELIALFS